MNCIISMKYLKQINGTVNITKSFIMKLLEQKTLSKDSTLLERKKSERVRLNHATTTYQQPKYIHHHPSPPTTSQNILTITHYHPPPAKIYPPPPTTSQNTSTTTYNFPKNGPPPRKSQIYSYIFPFGIVVTVSFSWK